MSILSELEKLLQEAAREAARQQAGHARDARQHAARQQPIRPAAGRRSDDAADAEVIEAEPVYESVAEHVAECVDTSDITKDVERLVQNASQLGDEIREEERLLEERLQHTFDGQVTRLHGKTETDTTGLEHFDDVSTAVGDIARALRNPKSICQAVILKEILDRPENRW